MGQSASKEKFAESVRALIQVEVSPDDADFWDELWKIPSSAEEVFELISSESARKLRDDRFGNLATLFTQAVAQLCQIVETPYNIYFDQALNCVRVLTRILPFLLEKGKYDNAGMMSEANQKKTRLTCSVVVVIAKIQGTWEKQTRMLSNYVGELALLDWVMMRKSA